MIWLNLATLKSTRHTLFVVDEADMTLDMGFLDTVDKIASTLPKDVQIFGLLSNYSTKIATVLEEIFGKSCHGKNQDNNSYRRYHR